MIQPIKFALAGGLATASHWLVMVLMVGMGVQPVIATAVGAFIGAMVNYIMQRNVTFKFNATHRSILPRYISVCILMWIANLLLFFLLYHTLLPAVMYAQGITTIVVALMSYYLYQRIVFNEQQSPPIY